MSHTVKQGERHVRRLTRFQDHLAAAGRSHKTIKDYCQVMLRLDGWARGCGYKAETLPPYLLLKYVEERVPMSRSSRQHVRDAVRHWWTAMGREDDGWQVVRVPTETPPVCRALEPDDARRLWKAAVAWDQGPEGLAVLLGQQQGLRRAEIAGLEWGGFDDEYTKMRFVGKGPKEAVLPVHPVVRDKLRWWRGWGDGLDSTDCRTRPGGVHVFDGKSTRPHVTPTTVWTWVKKVGESVGVKLTTHQLRHTFGAEANDQTKDLRATQELMRHTHSTTTERYTRVGWARMIETLMSVDYEEVS